MDVASGGPAPKPLTVLPDLPPPVAGVEVRRERLLRRLRALPVDVQLVAFVAPRGYGKTTTVRQWTDGTRDAVHWLSAGWAGRSCWCWTTCTTSGAVPRWSSSSAWPSSFHPARGWSRWPTSGL